MNKCVIKDELSAGMVTATILIALFMKIPIPGDELMIIMLMPIIGLVLCQYWLGSQEVIEEPVMTRKNGKALLYIVGGIIGIGLFGVIGKNLSIVEGLSVVAATTTVSLIAVGEEQLFRGFVYEWLVEKTGTRAVAVLGSASLFTAYHVWRYSTVFGDLFYVLMAGIILGYACFITKRLWPAMVIHAVVNIISLGGGS